MASDIEIKRVMEDKVVPFFQVEYQTLLDRITKTELLIEEIRNTIDNLKDGVDSMQTVEVNQDTGLIEVRPKKRGRKAAIEEE